MKNYQHSILFLLALCLLLGCNQQKSASHASSQVDAQAGPNMFGHYIPRGLTLSTENLMEGYVMFAVTNAASIYLINRKGEVVHEWKGNYGVLGAYLNDDGSLIQNAQDPDFPVFAGGGESGRLQKIAWDSKIVWDFEYANEDHHVHHDMAVMPNGNVLAIAWESKTAEEALKAGRKPELIPKAGIWPDKIVEIKPEGKSGGEIVWEWHIWDHLIQDYDAKMDNYGDPAAHPELLDINVGEPLPPPISQDSLDKLHALHRAWRNQTLDNRGSDIYHFNSVNYNAALDQIVIGSPNLNEIFIIDHSTTTAEAAGHEGGKWGRGGDFLYRWGNPQNYRRGDSTHQQLFHQHDARWIEEGKPGAGNLTVYNNAIPLGRDSLQYSAVYEITPPMDEKGNYLLTDNNPFGPDTPAWQYIAPDTVSFFGEFISGAHRMRNGNTLINEGPRGRFFEVTPDKEIVWEYLTQYRGDIRYPNGDPRPVMPMTYIQFRATFIPKDHPALAGRTLAPLEPQPQVFKLPPRTAQAGNN